MITKIREWLKGKKTYLVAAIAVLSVIVAFANGEVSIVVLIETILAALGLTSIRAAITKMIAELKK